MKIIVILMVTVDQYILFRMILLGLDTDVGFIKLKVKNKVNDPSKKENRVESKRNTSLNFS